MAAFDELTFIVLISWQLSQKSQQGENLLPKLLHFTFSEMIKAILIFNNHGKPRLNKFYQYYVSMLLITNFLCPGSFISHCHMLLYLANINDIFIQINSAQIFFCSWSLSFSEWRTTTTDCERNISISVKKRW